MTLKQLFTVYDGRINRQTFWIAFGLGIAAAIVLNIIFSIIGLSFGLAYLIVVVVEAYFFGAVAAKRLHDMGQTGWLALLFIVPIVSLGMLIWLGVVEGPAGDNAYGSPQSAQLEFKWA